MGRRHRHVQQDSAAHRDDGVREEGATLGLASGEVHDRALVGVTGQSQEQPGVIDALECAQGSGEQGSELRAAQGTLGGWEGAGVRRAIRDVWARHDTTVNRYPGTGCKSDVEPVYPRYVLHAADPAGTA